MIWWFDQFEEFLCCVAAGLVLRLIYLGEPIMMWRTVGTTIWRRSSLGEVPGISHIPHNSFISTTISIQMQAQARFLHWFQPHKKSPILGRLLFRVMMWQSITLSVEITLSLGFLDHFQPHRRASSCLLKKSSDFGLLEYICTHSPSREYAYIWTWNPSAMILSFTSHGILFDLKSNK